MPLSGQELHFSDQIDGLLDRVDRIERFLGGRWKIADATHVHDFKVSVVASKHVAGAVAEAVCQCGAEIVGTRPRLK